MKEVAKPQLPRASKSISQSSSESRLSLQVKASKQVPIQHSSSLTKEKKWRHQEHSSKAITGSILS